jgi:hypothetical protein
MTDLKVRPLNSILVSIVSLIQKLKFKLNGEIFGHNITDTSSTFDILLQQKTKIMQI